MSKIMQAALDPSCLLCLTPLGWYSPLRQGVVWPGSPRNFATEPATWYDAIRAVQDNAVTEFSLEFKIDALVNSVYIGPIIVTLLAGSGARVYLRTIADGVETGHYPFGASYFAVGTGSVMRVEVSVADGVMVSDWYIDGVMYKTASLPVSSAAQLWYNAGTTNANVSAVAANAKTGGKIVWSYPSYAERLRLITNTNVLNTGTHWEAANPALGWSIKTALPAGIAGTVLAKINGEYIVNPAQWNRTTATFTGAATDTLEGLMVFNEVITYEQIAYLCGVKRWVIPVSAGNINIVTVGFQNLRWTFPDGSTSTAASINQTVAAGVITCEYVGLLNGQLTINNSSALASSIMRAIDLPRATSSLTLNTLPELTGTTADLPRVTSNLTLYNLQQLTGTTADLPRVTSNLTFYNLQQLTGTTADLPRVTSNLYLNNLPGLTGTTADLPRVTNYLYLYNLQQLTGTIADLPRVTSNLTLYNLQQLTGTTADLPRVTSNLYLYNLQQLTGTTADLPRVTNTLQINNLSQLTGTIADLPVNTGERRCYIVANVTGALSVVATNTPIYFYATGATALEYDETVHNCVVAGGLSKILHIGTGTSAGDADIQTLRDRGWSVTIH